jgi:hypothetical protein
MDGSLLRRSQRDHVDRERCYNRLKTRLNPYAMRKHRDFPSRAAFSDPLRIIYDRKSRNFFPAPAKIYSHAYRLLHDSVRAKSFHERKK